MGTRVIWTRTIDRTAHRRRYGWLALLGGAPSLLAMACLGVVQGPMEALGLCILTGGFGAMVAVGIAAANLSESMNPTLSLTDDGQLVLGQGSGARRVKLGDVVAWSTGLVEETAFVYVPNSRGSSDRTDVRTARLVFRVRTEDGEDTVRTGWPEMPQSHLDEVRASVAPHLEAPWVPLEELGSEPLGDGRDG